MFNRRSLLTVIIFSICLLCKTSVYAESMRCENGENRRENCEALLKTFKKDKRYRINNEIKGSGIQNGPACIYFHTPEPRFCFYFDMKGGGSKSSVSASDKALAAKIKECAAKPGRQIWRSGKCITLTTDKPKSPSVKQSDETLAEQACRQLKTVNPDASCDPLFTDQEEVTLRGCEWYGAIPRRVLSAPGCSVKGKKVCSGYVTCSRPGDGISVVTLASCSEDTCGDDDAQTCAIQNGDYSSKAVGDYKDSIEQPVDCAYEGTCGIDDIQKWKKKPSDEKNQN